MLPICFPSNVCGKQTSQKVNVYRHNSRLNGLKTMKVIHQRQGKAWMRVLSRGEATHRWPQNAAAGFFGPTPASWAVKQPFPHVSNIRVAYQGARQSNLRGVIV
jgi:hypothetical protein